MSTAVGSTNGRVWAHALDTLSIPLKVPPLRAPRDERQQRLNTFQARENMHALSGGYRAECPTLKPSSLVSGSMHLKALPSRP